MTIQYRFPFGVISDTGVAQTATGSITVTETRFNISTTVEFTNVSVGRWNNQISTGAVDIEMNDSLLYESELYFKITCTLDNSDCILLVFMPELIHDKLLDTYLYAEVQTVVDTEFSTSGTWQNLPIKNNQQANTTLVTYVQETEKTVIGNLANTFTFREEMIYVSAEPTKPDMPLDQNIEYYLGKDRLKNLYFKPTIPAAWEIPARILNPALNVRCSMKGFFRGDPKEYCFNNLGYRSQFDYIQEELADKRIVVCLGDSDTFGVGLELTEIWPNLVQTDATVLNLSVPGISIDGIARIVVQTVQALGSSVDAVLAFYPSMSLREFVSKKYKGGVHTHRNYNLPYADWWEHIDWQSNNYNFNKNQLLMQGICAKYGIQFHDLYINRTDKKVPYDFFEYGVYSSIGKVTHQAIGNYFSRKIKGEPSLFQTLQS
jgi:hypothetical protein